LNKTEPDFTWREGLAFSLAFIGVQLCSETFNQWGTYFYSPTEGGGRTIYVPIGMVGFMFVIATLWDAITDPLIGAWSDRTKTKPGRFRFPRIKGRRRPFIFWGSILTVFTFVAAWYPPVEDTHSLNFVYGTVMLCLHWMLFTVTSVPILALGPEIARTTEARVKLGIWIAVGYVAGLTIANVLSGMFLGMLDPRDGGVASPEAYRKLALIYALLSLALFQFLVWTVRERYTGQKKDNSFAALVREGKDVIQNSAFVAYFFAFFFFSAGLLAAQRALPYWAEIGLAGNEGTVTILLIPYILTCLLTYPAVPFLQRMLGVKWTVFLSLFILSTSLPWMYPIGMADITPGTKQFWGAVLFGYAGIGQGIMYVMLTPLIGEIIDYDAAKSGERREAVYNGLSGVAWKASMAGAVILATQSMSIFGNSVDNPTGIYLVGPLAGICGLLGCAAMYFYPKIGPEDKAPPPL